MRVEDVSNLIERLEAFEERVGVRLESLSAQLARSDDHAYLTVLGEVHPQAGTDLQEDVELVIAVYDSSARVVGTASHSLEASTFFGFETFEIVAEIYVNKVTRVRIYPKRSE